MLELDEQHGTVDAVVEDPVRIAVTDPREVRVGLVGEDLGHPDAGVTRVRPARVQRGQLPGQGPLTGGQRSERQALVVQFVVVAEGTDEQIVR
ncbi:hypothetical protein OHA51_47440 [Streptomyces sp. NBC_00589]|nr:hypothetical protein [Streptomyces sp. NBC_00589]WUB32433.1 hypothetical protein OHA51_47440 [Streptomyces sp. NBC_00589]